MTRRSRLSSVQSPRKFAYHLVSKPQKSSKGMKFGRRPRTMWDVKRPRLSAPSSPGTLIPKSLICSRLRSLLRKKSSSSANVILRTSKNSWHLVKSNWTSLVMLNHFSRHFKTRMSLKRVPKWDLMTSLRTSSETRTQKMRLKSSTDTNINLSFHGGFWEKFLTLTKAALRSKTSLETCSRWPLM